MSESMKKAPENLVEQEGKKVGKRETLEFVARSVCDGLSQEKTPEQNHRDIVDRLEMDLLQDSTADYQRMNFIQMFVFFGADARLSATHWRIAKIMDALTFCSKEFNILEQEFAFKDITEKIYPKILNGQIGEQDVEINLPGSDNKKKVSLVDLTYFYDLVKANRRLCTNRLAIDTLANKFFNGQEIKIDDNGTEIDLINGVRADDPSKKINPKDSYSGMEEDVRDYLEFIKQNQHRAELNAHWRFNSAGHRELGGHVFMLELEGDLCYVPVSGRLASKITLEDLQKAETGGLNGQPQEVGEMDEKNTGAIIRFNLTDLAQRRKGGDVRNIACTQRLAKAMMGLTLADDAYKQIHNIDKEGKKTYKQINLCGKRNKDNFELDGDCSVIRGIMTHYNGPFKKMRGRGMSKEEAADVAFLDVFAPCILNNPNDWLLALAKTYGLTGGVALLNKAYADFGDFEVVIYSRDKNDPENGEIKANTFNNMTELWNYVVKRASLGHIDQPTAMLGDLSKKFSDITKDSSKATEKDFALDGEAYVFNRIKDANHGRDVCSALQEVLGEYAPKLLDLYRKNGSEFSSPAMVVNGKVVPFDEKIKGRARKPFKDNLKDLLRTLDDGMRLNFVAKVYFNGDVDQAEEAIGNDLDSAIDGFLDSIMELDDNERQKIK